MVTTFIELLSLDTTLNDKMKIVVTAMNDARRGYKRGPARGFELSVG